MEEWKYSELVNDSCINTIRATCRICLELWRIELRGQSATAAFSVAHISSQGIWGLFLGILELPEFLG